MATRSRHEDEPQEETKERHPTATTDPTPPAKVTTQSLDEAQAATHAAIRSVNSAFTSNIPAEAVSSGAYDMVTPRFPDPIGPSVEAVPDGLYRVAGSEWAITIAGGKVAAFERMRPGVDYPGLVAVPAQ